jgi:hypothetical protein
MSVHNGREGMAEQNNSQHCVQEAERSNRKGPGQDIASRTSPSCVTYFLQPGRKFHHLPISTQIFESINGLNYSLGQSPHDLIVSANPPQTYS